jgi:hypothetical protein
MTQLHLRRQIDKSRLNSVRIGAARSPRWPDRAHAQADHAVFAQRTFRCAARTAVFVDRVDVSAPGYGDGGAGASGMACPAAGREVITDKAVRPTAALADEARSAPTRA